MLDWSRHLLTVKLYGASVVHLFVCNNISECLFIRYMDITTNNWTDYAVLIIEKLFTLDKIKVLVANTLACTILTWESSIVNIVCSIMDFKRRQCYAMWLSNTVDYLWINKTSIVIVESWKISELISWKNGVKQLFFATCTLFFLNSVDISSRYAKYWQCMLNVYICTTLELILWLFRSTLATSMTVFWLHRLKIYICYFESRVIKFTVQSDKL